MKNRVSPFIFKWMMNLYPPFLFGRIRVKKVSNDFTYIRVKINSSLLNKNLSSTLFGGTMFSAADPFYALMYWQIFAHRYDQRVRVWLKAANIKYVQPAIGNQILEFRLQEEDILSAKEALDKKGKYVKTHEVLIKNKHQEISAIVQLDTYVGLMNR